MSELWADVTNPNTPTNWVVVEVEKDSIVPIASGTGIESFCEAFTETKIQWGVINVYGVDQQDNVTSRRPKYVQINWVGPRVPAMKRLGALSGKAPVTALFQGVQVTIDCNDKNELDKKTIGKALLQCGGAHKPTHYDFGGDDTISLEDLGYH